MGSLNIHHGAEKRHAEGHLLHEVERIGGLVESRTMAASLNNFVSNRSRHGSRSECGTSGRAQSRESKSMRTMEARLRIETIKWIIIGDASEIAWKANIPLRVSSETERKEREVSSVTMLVSKTSLYWR